MWLELREVPSLACMHCTSCRNQVWSHFTGLWNQMVWSREVTKPLLKWGYFSRSGCGMLVSERKAKATRWTFCELPSGREPLIFNHDIILSENKTVQGDLYSTNPLPRFKGLPSQQFIPVFLETVSNGIVEIKRDCRQVPRLVWRMTLTW